MLKFLREMKINKFLTAFLAVVLSTTIIYPMSVNADEDKTYSTKNEVINLKVGEEKTIKLKNSDYDYYQWVVDQDNDVIRTSNEKLSRNTKEIKVTALKEGTTYVSLQARNYWREDYKDIAVYTINVEKAGTAETDKQPEVSNKKQTAYYYIQVPGLAKGTDTNINPDKYWYGYGLGTINVDVSASEWKGKNPLALGDAGTYYTEGGLPNDDLPVIQHAQTGKYYTYCSQEPCEAGTYKLKLEKVSVAEGANSGINHKFDVVTSKTYHVDYNAILFDDELATVTFEVLNPGAVGYETLSSKGYYKYNKYNELKVPSISKKDGYVFGGWYEGETHDYTNKVNFDSADKIGENKNFYGRYVKDFELTSQTHKFTYNGEPQGEAYTAAPEGAVVEYKVDGQWTTEVPTVTDSGTYTYEVRANLNGLVREGGKLIYEVSKAPITITPKNDTRTYGGNTQELDGYDVEGLLEGYTLETVNSTKASGIDVNEYSFNVSAENAKVTKGTIDETKNFEITVANDGVGTLTITPLPITVRATAATKKYGENDPNLYATLSRSTYGRDGIGLEVSRASDTHLFENQMPNVYKDDLIVNVEGTGKANYDFTYVPADFTIIPTDAKIEITANSKSKPYNGQPLTDDGYGLSEETKRTLQNNGDKVVATTKGSQTLPGTADNEIDSFSIVHYINEEKTVDVTDCYANIIKNKGTLTVEQLEFDVETLTPKILETEYGTTLKAGIDGTIPEIIKDKLVVKYSVLDETTNKFGEFTNEVPTLKNVGELTYQVELSTTDGSFKPTVLETKGVLKVTPANIKVSVADDAKVYDGKPLNNTQEIKIEGFKYDDEFKSYSVSGEITNVDKVQKTFNYTINQDIKANYIINLDNVGYLEITPRPITVNVVANSSLDNVYNGESYTASGYTVESIEGQEGIKTLYTKDDFTYSGNNSVSGIDVNEYPFVLEQDKFVNNNHNFTPTFVVTNGLLTIVPQTKEITALTDSEVYGETLTASANNADSNLTYEYLYKNEDGSWSSEWVSEAKTIKNVGTLEYKVRVKASNYVSNEAEGSLTITPAELTITPKNANKIYGANDPTFTANVSGSKYDDVINYELVREAGELVGHYVISVAVDADDYSNYTITTNTADFEITQNMNPIIVTTGTKSNPYNGQEFSYSEENAYTGTLVEGDKLTITNTASVKDVEAGEVKNSATVLIKKGDLDVTACYGNITINPGIISITKRPITIKTQSEEFTYDGNFHSSEDFEVVNGSFVDGEGITCDNYTTVKDVTSADGVNNICDYKAASNTDLNNYEITWNYGKLVVKSSEKSPLTFGVESLNPTKVYDGEPLTANVVVSGNVAGDEIKIEYFVNNSWTTTAPQITNVVESNSFKVRASHPNYKTIEDEVTLTIKEREVEVTSLDADKPYDGKALTFEQARITSGSLVGSDELVYTFTGSQTVKGTSANTFTALVNGVENPNYKITTIPGNLTVNLFPQKVVLTADSLSKTYNGSPLTKNSFTTNIQLAEGDTVTANVEGSITDVTKGGVANKIDKESIKIMHGDVDATGSYEIDVKDGLLSIDKREVYLTSGNAEALYNPNKALTNDKVTITGEGFADGEGVKTKVIGSQANVGTSFNEFTYDAKHGTNLDNYTIHYNEGTLTVYANINYDGNGAASGEVVDNTNYYLNDLITVLDANNLKREEAVVIGWSYTKHDQIFTQRSEIAALASDFVEFGQEIKQTETPITLYAVWAEDKKGGSDDKADMDQILFTYVSADPAIAEVSGTLTEIYDITEVNSAFAPKANISFENIQEGYTFDYINDGSNNYHNNALDSIRNNKYNQDTIFTVYFDEDILGNEETGKSDGVADKYQIMFTYTTDSQDDTKGVISSNNDVTLYETFTFDSVEEKNANGANPTIALEATAKDGFAFEYWNDSINFDYSKNMDKLSENNYKTNRTFVAYFDTDILGNEETGKSDGIADKYQIMFTYKADETQGHLDKNGKALNIAYETFTGYNPDGSYKLIESARPSLTLIPVANEKFAFDHWSIEGEESIDMKPLMNNFKNQDYTQNTTFVANFGTDEVGTDPNNPNVSDGNPDIYQAKVTYNVINGESSIKETYVTLYDEEGNYAIDGKGHLNEAQLPIVVANEGYVKGNWDVVPSVELDIIEDTVLTFTCDIDEVGTDPNNPEKGDGIADKYQVRVDYVVENGVSSVDYTYVTLLDENDKPAITGKGYLTEVQLPIVKADENYMLGTWNPETPTTEIEITAAKTFTMICEADAHGIDPENPNKPDNIPDKYQVRVQFVAVNGTLSHNEAYVTLIDENGSAVIGGVGHLKAAQIPTSSANEGYYNGTWDVTPTTELDISEATTFTLTYVAVPVTPTPTPRPNPTPNPEPSVTPIEDVQEVQDIDNSQVTPLVPHTPEVDNIKDDVTPAEGDAGWALLNLVATLATAILAIILLVSKTHKDDDEDENVDNAKNQEETQAELKRNKIWKVISIIVAVVSVVVFFLTEDMSLPMAMTDKWTIVMAIILIVNIVCFFFGRQWKDNDDEEQQA